MATRTPGYRPLIEADDILIDPSEGSGARLARRTDVEPAAFGVPAFVRSISARPLRDLLSARARQR